MASVQEDNNTTQTREDDSTEDKSMSHVEAMEITKATLARIISNEPLLCDLPTEITLEEINSQIALEYGQAMVVNVCRADLKVMPIVVTQTATVLDLKNAIKRYFTLHQAREGEKTNLNWRYTWKRFWLYFDGQKLSDNNKPLKEYGIRNRDEVTFVKRLKER